MFRRVEFPRVDGDAADAEKRARAPAAVPKSPTAASVLRLTINTFWSLPSATNKYCCAGPTTARCPHAPVGERRLLQRRFLPNLPAFVNT
jgi:hypothetical protein